MDNTLFIFSLSKKYKTAFNFFSNALKYLHIISIILIFGS